MNAALARMQSSPEDVDWAAVGRAALQALDERDVLIWIDDAPVSSLMSRLGWDGAVRQAVGDYWMVVDANLGFNKVNAVVDTSIAYTVTLQADGSADAEMTIHYRHTGTPAEGCRHYVEYSLSVSYEQLMQACYWNYLRLYVPEQAQLNTLSSHPVPADFLVVNRPFDGRAIVEREMGKSVFATLFVLEQGSALDVSAAYHWPPSVVWTEDGAHYNLTMQKQAGAAPHPVSVTLAWPEGYRLAQTSTSPVRFEAQTATFAFALSTDQTLSVSWTRD
jgi:hypothetical protein